MKKGLIILDIPENCSECPLQYEDYENQHWCNQTNDIISDINSKPDWCPIKSIPEKIEFKTRHDTNSEHYAKGWNKCIEEILEGVEDE